MEVYSLKERASSTRNFWAWSACATQSRRCGPAGLKFHIVAVEVGAAVHPVNVLNHWGMDVNSDAEVDDAYQMALKPKDKYKIRQVLKPVRQTACYRSTWRTSTTTGGDPAYPASDQDLFDFGDRYRDGRRRRGAAQKELDIKTTA